MIRWLKVSPYGAIFVEDLNIGGLSRGILAKSVQDASWSSFLEPSTSLATTERGCPCCSGAPSSAFNYSSAWYAGVDPKLIG
jgi:hypothetical protein